MSEGEHGSAVESQTGPRNEVDPDDPAALLDALFDEGVLAADERTDAITTSAEFEDAYEVYLDTYVSMPDLAFVESVAEVFELESADAAAQQVEELGVSRAQLAAYLALGSALDGTYDAATRSRMAVVVADLEPETPVPECLTLLDDDTYEAFVVTNDRAVVTVWARRCDPCEAMKNEIDAVLTALSGTTVAGIDGDTEGEFCASYGVDAAPALVFFEAGDHRRTVTGRTDPEEIEGIVETVHG